MLRKLNNLAYRTINSRYLISYVYRIDKLYYLYMYVALFLTKITNYLIIIFHTQDNPLLAVVGPVGSGKVTLFGL